MSSILQNKIPEFSGCSMKLLALSVAAMGGNVWADTISIPAGGSVDLSAIYGTGPGQTNKLSDLVFNGTSSVPSTLVVGSHPGLTPVSWDFDAAGGAGKRIGLG